MLDDLLRNPRTGATPWGKLVAIGTLVLAIIIAPMVFGINDAGHRTVVQFPNGTLFVKFAPGIYPQWFGSTTEYNDVVTMDYDKSENSEGATMDQLGIDVRYQDGGMGAIFGITRFALPGDEDTMLHLHKEFRSNEGLAYKLLKPVMEESANLTAGLMTSESAYAENRNIFGQWTRQQLDDGKFETILKEITETDEVTGKTVTKFIPEISYGANGKPIQSGSDLDQYGISISGLQLTDWGFEPKTMKQISDKRDATMAVITAKANAEKAKQDEITAEAVGKAAVVTAKYAEEKIAAKEIVNAEKAVKLAAQVKLENKEKALAADFYKKEQILRGEGDAAYKKLVMTADGALAQKLEAYKQVNQYYASAIAQQKWVPEISFAGGEGSNGNQAQALMEMFTAKTAKDLSLDMAIK